MQLFVIRLVAVAAFVLIYALNATLGVAVLAGSFGYVVAARRYRPTAACEPNQ